MGISQLPLEWPQNLGGKAYHLYQDFSDSDKKLAYLDFNYNKEVRWGYYPTHPSPTSGRKSSEEFVSVLEGGEWDDLDGVDQFPVGSYLPPGYNVFPGWILGSMDYNRIFISFRQIFYVWSIPSLQFTCSNNDHFFRFRCGTTALS